MIYEPDFLIDKSDESLLAELCRVAKLLGKNTLTQDELNEHGNITSGPIKRRFGTWNTALEKAGLHVKRRMNITNEEIFADIGNVLSKLEGRTPSQAEFDAHSKLTTSALLKKRFGGIRPALDEFAKQQGGKRPEQLGDSPTNSQTQLSRSIALADRSASREFGEFINFRGMLHAPVNEQGVVFLFGMLAHKLGFIVEGIYQGFPDCEAKRRGKKGNFRRVTIEFEFRSSGYRKDHVPKQQWCDLIICWEHDWKDCPIEVLELSHELKQLSDQT